jgi:hypothetical protein
MIRPITTRAMIAVVMLSPAMTVALTRSQVTTVADIITAGAAKRFQAQIQSKEEQSAVAARRGRAFPFRDRKSQRIYLRRR